jgi:hypothetical protein
VVERFNGRVQREVLGITLYSHQNLETLLAGFNVAYNSRRQRVLKGHSPDMVLRERLKAKPERAKPVTKPPDPDALPRALTVVADAKEVPHPDNLRFAKVLGPITRLFLQLNHRPLRRARAGYAQAGRLGDTGAPLAVGWSHHWIIRR